MTTAKVVAINLRDNMLNIGVEVRDEYNTVLNRDLIRCEVNEEPRRIEERITAFALATKWMGKTISV